MFATAVEFSFAFPDETPVLSAGRRLAQILGADEAISRRSLNEALRATFGGTDADGQWSTSDGHAALELAQAIWLRDHGGLTASSSAADAIAVFDGLEARLVPQHNRSQAQMALQQFSTPPRLAWLAARACALRPDELLLEPSAGTGMLAVWAHLAGTSLALNELDASCRDYLASLFPSATLSRHDGELIDELLDPRLVPSAVLMNPPYSVGLERGADGRTGSRHLRAAFRRLAPGGRLVAIMPEWFDAARFGRKLAPPPVLRLNLTIERAFARHGTSIATRLVVFDKVEADSSAIVGATNDFTRLCELVDRLPPRSARIQPSTVPQLIRPTQALRLVPAQRGPSLLAPTRQTRTVAVVPLAFEVLEAPAHRSRTASATGCGRRAWDFPFSGSSVSASVRVCARQVRSMQVARAARLRIGYKLDVPTPARVRCNDTTTRAPWRRIALPVFVAHGGLSLRSFVIARNRDVYVASWHGGPLVGFSPHLK